MLTNNIDYFKSKPDALSKTTILLDNGDRPEKLAQALEAIYPEMLLDGSSKERTLGSKDVKNFDRTLERSNAKLQLCSIGIVVKRL